MNNINKEQKKINIKRMKGLFRFFIVLFFVALMFWILSGICFGLVEILIKYNLSKVQFYCDWMEFLTNPMYVFSLYEDWWSVFIQSLRSIRMKGFLFIPFFAIGVSLVLFISIILRNTQVLQLWYISRFGFAKLKDIKKMGLTENLITVLGRFSGRLLRGKQNSSVLCVGDMGIGKTSSVSIPSVLNANNANIIAVDLTGILPKYTAGYRSRLGEVFYLNWDCLDDPKNNFFYARWNPLVSPHLPDDMSAREEYLNRLVSYFIDIDNNDENNYWNLKSHKFVKTILHYWIVKINQAKANDYFLSKLIENEKLDNTDKDILLSYYVQMHKSMVDNVVEKIKDGELNYDDYIPIGSWAGTMDEWIGKDPCFAMIIDWLIDAYTNETDAEGKDWSGWLKSLLKESIVFTYGNYITEGFKQILALSVQQRTMVLEKAIKSLLIFTEESIRERTNGNDIDFADIRGIYDFENNKWKPTTVYSIANTTVAKVINRLFIDELLYYAMKNNNVGNDMPILFVLDDVGHNMYLQNLENLLEKGKEKNIFTILLCNSLSLVANTYGRTSLEKMIMLSDYKIIKSTDAKHLSQLLDKLASFSSRTVKKVAIIKKLFRRKKIDSEATCFRKLAKIFKLYKNNSFKFKDSQLLLVKGWYNKPILADMISLFDDDKFAKLANYPPNYILPIQKVLQKEEQELQTPAASYINDE